MELQEKTTREKKGERNSFYDMCWLGKIQLISYPVAIWIDTVDRRDVQVHFVQRRQFSIRFPVLPDWSYQSWHGLQLVDVYVGLGGRAMVKPW